MTLSTAEQKAGMEKYVQQEHVDKNNVANVNTTEIIAEFVNLDVFITTNLTAINNAFTTSFKNKTTQQQRLKLFKIVVELLELQ